MKKKILTLTMIMFMLLGAVGCSNSKNKEEVSDAKKFAEEYKEVGEDNVFVYKEVDDIIKIMEHGTGIVYLGFPECPWCQAYVPYLNEVAAKNEITKIYYNNILNDRKEETEEYKKILELLQDYVEYDNEGNKRIYAPTVIFVSNGKIVGMDSETAKDTKGYKNPEEYWTDKRVKALKERLDKYSKLAKEVICSDCNK